MWSNSLPRREPTRIHAASLLEFLAFKDDAEALWRILLSCEEDGWVRFHVLRTLKALDVALPAGALEGLFQIWSEACERIRQGREEIPGNQLPAEAILPSLTEILSLARLPGKMEAAEKFLSTLDCADRVALLSGMWNDPAGIPPRLRRWLYRSWRRQDWQANLERSYLIASARRPSAFIAGLVLGHWWSLGGYEKAGFLRKLSREKIRELFRGRETEFQDAVTNFYLPLGFLLEHLGPDALISAIEKRFNEVGGLEEVIRFLDGEYKPDFFSRAVWLLRDWFNTDEAGVLAVAPESFGPILARLKARRRLYRDDRPDVRSWIRKAVADRDSSSTARGALSTIAEAPDPADRDLFLHILGTNAEPRMLYCALAGMENLREDGEAWRRNLKDLARDAHPLIRARAHAALARRGTRASVEALAEAATMSQDLCERAEAVRWIGEIDAAGHADLLRKVLLEDHETMGDGYHSPVCQEAAFAIARLPGLEPMTLLLRAALIAPGNPEWDALNEYLKSRALASPEEPYAGEIYANNWRGWIPCS